MIKEYLVPALVLGATIACVTTGFVAYDMGQDSKTLFFEAKIDKANKEHAAETTALTKAASDASDKHVLAMSALDTKYLEQRDVDKAKSDATLAAYRSDNLRLHERFRNRPVPACNGTETTPSSGSGDEAQSVGLRDEDVQFLVRFADDADQVADALRTCQGAVTNYQELYRVTWPDAAKAILEGE